MRITLRHRYVPGQRLLYRTTMRGLRETDAGVAEEMTRDEIVEHRVLGVDPDGAAHLVVRSAAVMEGRDVDEAEASLADVAVVAYLHVSARGEVGASSSSRPEFGYVLPEEPVAEGAVWSLAGAMPLPLREGTTPTEFRYRFDSVERVDGRDCVCLALHASFGSEGAPGPSTTDVEGTLHFDPVAGMLVRATAGTLTELTLADVPMRLRMLTEQRLLRVDDGGATPAVEEAPELLRHRYRTGERLLYRGVRSARRELGTGQPIGGDAPRREEAVVEHRVVAVDGDGAHLVLRAGHDEQAAGRQTRVSYLHLDSRGRVRAASSAGPGFMYELPEARVETGDGWRSSGAVGGVALQYAYQVESVVGDVVDVALEARADDAETTTPQGEPAHVSLEAHGHLSFDRAAGRLLTLQASTKATTTVGWQSETVFSEMEQTLIRDRG